jgi:RNA polymerase sigma-54 factor
MQKVIKTILRLQKEYFQSGDIQLLKPMILKDVAHIIDMDIATVSRVTSGKYAQTLSG